MFNPEFLPSLPSCIQHSGRSSRPGARSPEEVFRHMSSGDRRPRTGVQRRAPGVLPSNTIIPITGYDGTVALRPVHRKPLPAYGACHLLHVIKASGKATGVAISVARVGPAGRWDGACPSPQSLFEPPLGSRFSASTIGVEIASKSETVKLIGPLMPALAIRLVSVRHQESPIL